MKGICCKVGTKVLFAGQPGGAGLAAFMIWLSRDHWMGMRIISGDKIVLGSSKGSSGE